MTTGLILGAALGASICLLLFALVPPRPRLGAEVQRWQRQRAARPATTRTTTRTAAARPATDAVGGGTVGVSPRAGPVPSRGLDSWFGRASDLSLPGVVSVWGGWMAVQLARRGITLGRLRADLEITDASLESHLVRKVAYGLVGLLLPGVFAVVLTAGGITVSFTVPTIAGLVLAVAFFWLPDLTVANEAERRRSELRRALSCYLDLVSMSLAGGRGIPQALPAAARIGTGWAFELLQDTIEHARYIGITPWAALVELGERTGMQELQDLGGALLLVADDGAKVRSSLTARASTQRRRQLAEAEGAAAKADQSIQLAHIVLGVGFFLFLGFPAVVAVMGV